MLRKSSSSAPSAASGAARHSPARDNALLGRRSLLGLGTVGLAGLTAGCATGPRVAEVRNRIPPIPDGMGRIWFYRAGDLQGSAVQPAIRLNGQTIGDSVPGGAFFRDVPPGEYTVSTATEVERRITFPIAAGEERFVRTNIGMGFFIGRVTPELVDGASARPTVAELSFTGSP